MKKQSNTTNTKSKTQTSKTGQNFLTLCIECNKPFQGYTKAQKVCTDDCLLIRASRYGTEYEITKQHRKLVKEQIEVAELEVLLEQTKVQRNVIAYNEQKRLDLLMELLEEVKDCMHKPDVVMYMDKVMPEYE